MKKREIWINIKVSLLSILAVLFVLEICLRILFYREYFYERNLYEADSTLGFKLHPGARLISSTGYNVSISPQGLREERIYETPKPAGVYRYLFLGDSFTYACVDKQASFESLFEEILRKNSDNKVEVINAGVPGYGTYHELRFLKSQGLKFHSDKVVLFFFLNDLNDNLLGKNLATVISGYLVKTNGTEADFWYRLKTGLRLHYLTLRFLYEKINDIQNKRRGQGEKKGYPGCQYYSVLVGDFAGNKALESGWRKTEEQFLETKSLLDRNKIGFEVVFLPTRYHIYESDRNRLEKQMHITTRPDIINTRMSQFMLRHNIAYYDMTSDLKSEALRHKESFYFATDEHFNELGNAVVAELLARHFRPEVENYFKLGDHLIGK
jgi:lysophospholipase L1-like esterase